MNTIDRICAWGDTHHPRWLDFFRIVLGVTILIKGAEFAKDPRELKEVFEGWDVSLWSLFMIHYIPMAHLVGGLLITVGLLTRVAVLFQLPVLIGAVALKGQADGMFHIYSEWSLAAFVLSLLVVFFFLGSGSFSVDATLKEPNKNHHKTGRKHIH